MSKKISILLGVCICGALFFAGCKNSAHMAVPLDDDDNKQASYETFTVKLDANGGTAGSKSSVTIPYASSLSAIFAAECAPSRLGYDFRGWAKTPSATASNLTSSTMLSSLISDSATSLTVYAVWVAAYPVNFVSNPPAGLAVGGSMPSQTFFEKESQPIAKCAFSLNKNPWKFAGWAKTAQGKVEFADSEEIVVSSPMTLYAKWKISDVIYNLMATVGNLPAGEYIVEITGNSDTFWKDGNNINGYDGLLGHSGKGFCDPDLKIHFEVEPGFDDLPGVLQDNTSIVSVKIPSSIKRLQEQTFYQCTAIESVELAQGLEVIDFGVFDSCESLKSIEIPETVTSIGYHVFTYCRKLSTVTFKMRDPSKVSFGSSIFGRSDGACPIEKIYVPKGTLSKYKAVGALDYENPFTGRSYLDCLEEIEM